MRLLDAFKAGMAFVYTKHALLRSSLFQECTAHLALEKTNEVDESWFLERPCFLPGKSRYTWRIDVMTATVCKCHEQIRTLKICFAISLGLIVGLGISIWHKPTTVAHADTIPDQITTKRLVIVDNSGNEVATIGQQPDPNGPSTQLLISSPDKKATYSLRVGTATNANVGPFIFVDATSQLPGQGAVRSEVSQYTLRVAKNVDASASAYFIYPSTGTGIEHISTIHGDNVGTGMLTCSNGLAPGTCHNVN